MASMSPLKLQQSPLSNALSGYWKLVPAQACTLRPEETGILRVAHGKVWATLAGPHSGPANDWGDVVLDSGQEITLSPGQQLVVEPLGDAVNEPAFFSWEPRQPTAQPVAAGASPWHDPLARPHLGSSALKRPLRSVIASLATGMAAFSAMLVAGRGRVLSPLECNQP